MCLSGGKQRTYSMQSAYQAAALGLTLCMAIVGGLITGAILRSPIFVQNFENFEDEPNWHLPDDEVSTADAPSDTGSLNQNLNRRFSIIPPAASMNNNLQRRFSVFPT